VGRCSIHGVAEALLPRLRCQGLGQQVRPSCPVLIRLSDLPCPAPSNLGPLLNFNSVILDVVHPIKKINYKTSSINEE
jgi:hypothetical protein